MSTDFCHSIKAVLFDFDGTLTRPGALDFGFIRKSLGCPQGMPILEFIQSLKADADRRSARERLDRFELQGAMDSVPNTGAQETVAWLKRNGVSVGIITRNSRACVMRALQNFERLRCSDFDVMITRDDPPAPKPSGEGVLYAARRLKISAAEIMMVGDFTFDVQAGQAAGALTVLLDPLDDERLQNVKPDCRIRRLGELRGILAGPGA